jgi:diguanylate cyclase (GGDEF)-like protein/PAS domain S-box-containing protein
MMNEWSAGSLGLLAALIVYQQVRMYGLRRRDKKRDELFKIVTENAADMIALVDVKGRRLYNSPAYKRVLGYSAAELGETSSFEQIHPDDRFRVLQAAREARSNGIGQELEYRIRHKDGSWRIFESRASVLRDENGAVAKLVIVNRDITERRRTEEQLAHNAFHDRLTGLPNRRLFLDRLENLFVRSRRHPSIRYAVLFVDVDRFKEFNERMGHAAGDQVLVETGRRLGACLRQEDTISRGEGNVNDAVLSRLGGDEFTVLLDDVTDPSDALRVANRIQAAVAQPIVIEGREATISVSMGIALCAPPQGRAESLLRDAETAMRRAKSMGRARCEVFDEAMHTAAVRRLKLESELREAVARRQFRIFYHSVVQLENRRVVGFEALLRWQHPEQGLVSPHKFLEAAEEAGLMTQIGQWQIRQVCRMLQGWQADAEAEPVSIMVNISARQFGDTRFISDLRTILRESAVDTAQLKLDITESTAAADPKLTVAVLAHLKQMGIGVILDDFGTGHSSLSGLRHFPVEALKIDRSLLSEMLADRAVSGIIELIVTLGRKMNLRVIAEGIENSKQLERLREVGCEFGQGYLFSRPVEADAAERIWRQQRFRQESPKQIGANAR